MNERPRKHYFKMAARLGTLFLTRSDDCDGLVTQSYNRISGSYDPTWTHHMRDLTESLIKQLNPLPGQACLDLTCGTGFATHLLAQKTQTAVIGVDRSEGMLTQARCSYGHACDFIQADILDYLKTQEACSLDAVTCCWGLGYSKPLAVLGQIKRILKPHGKVAIIDNSLFSLREILYCSFLTFAEQPDKLCHLMRFKFLPNAWVLKMLFRMLRLNILYAADGEKSYTEKSGRDVIAKLRATGAAAGFEYACGEEDQEAIFNRFAEIIEEKYRVDGSITVTHRYLAGIAQK